MKLDAATLTFYGTVIAALLTFIVALWNLLRPKTPDASVTMQAMSEAFSVLSARLKDAEIKINSLNDSVRESERHLEECYQDMEKKVLEYERKMARLYTRLDELAKGGGRAEGGAA